MSSIRCRRVRVVSHRISDFAGLTPATRKSRQENQEYRLAIRRMHAAEINNEPLPAPFRRVANALRSIGAYC